MSDSHPLRGSPEPAGDLQNLYRAYLGRPQVGGNPTPVTEEPEAIAVCEWLNWELSGPVDPEGGVWDVILNFDDRQALYLDRYLERQTGDWLVVVELP